MNFKTFKSEPIHDGIQYLHFFPNGYGVSVVKHSFSYGGKSGYYELGVAKGDEKDWSLCYTTPVTDDVKGWLSEDEVNRLCREVSELNPNGTKKDLTVELLGHFVAIYEECKNKECTIAIIAKQAIDKILPILKVLFIGIALGVMAWGLFKMGTWVLDKVVTSRIIDCNAILPKIKSTPISAITNLTTPVSA